MAKAMVLLVWNEHSEGCKFYLFSVDSHFAGMAKAAQGQFINTQFDGPEVDSLNEALGAKDGSAPEPATLPLYGANIVAVYEAGFVP